ncbi:MAG TPA: YeeE/YedE thiosulfate transporter family protein [Selenomonadales bacterium]|nr:YeeE/YedE thiosulfate transporter family protein [Selenomonadales bacterium]
MTEAQTATTLIRRSPATPKKKKSQIGYTLAAIAVVAAIGIFLAQIKVLLSMIWFLGIGLGVILQKARFCFTASLRDPILTGSTSLTRATLIAFAVATVGFAALQFTNLLKGGPVIGNVSPVGIHTAIGAVLFGIGMVISGGCASGTLMRMGEGFAMQWISIITFVIGSVLGAMHFGWWSEHFFNAAPKIYLPGTFGWAGAFFGQLALLGVLYVLATWYEYRKSN